MFFKLVKEFERWKTEVGSRKSEEKNNPNTRDFRPHIQYIINKTLNIKL